MYSVYLCLIIFSVLGPMPVTYYNIFFSAILDMWYILDFNAEIAKCYVSDFESFLDRKRRLQCGECPGCTSEDCNQCKFCLDKKKNRGPGLKKQHCINRKCIRTVRNEIVLILSYFSQIT